MARQAAQSAAEAYCALSGAADRLGSAAKAAAKAPNGPVASPAHKA